VIALPRPAARPRPGWDGAGGGKTGLSEAFVGVRFAWGGWRKGATMFRAKVFSGGGERVEFGANHLRRVNLWRRFLTFCGEESALLVVVQECPISFQSRTSLHFIDPRSQLHSTV
jgi:hypothetical protein